MLKPNESEFEALAAQDYNLIPVWREIAADLETPVSAFLKVARGDYAFLLESVQGGEKWGRYTFLGSEPAMVMRGRGGRLDLTRPGRSVEVRSVKGPLEGLRDEMSRFRAYQSPDLPRFFGGAVGFLAYDIVRYFERLPTHAARRTRHARPLPDADRYGADLRQRASDPQNRRQRRARGSSLDPRRLSRRGGQDRRTDRAPRRSRPDAASGGPGHPQRRRQSRLQPDPRGLHGDGRGGQGVYRGRRRYPGGALAAFRGAPGDPSVQPLSQPANDQSVARTCSTCGWTITRWSARRRK